MTVKPFFIMGYLLLFSISTWGQTLRVNLDLRTTEDRATNHLEPFMQKPPVPLILPSVDTMGAQFMVVFYTYGHGDPYIYIMVIPHPEGEYLYIDRNYDHNLANDGPPTLFPKDANEFGFGIASREDSLQRTQFLLLRKANMFDEPDSVVTLRVDREGNLTPAFARRAAAMLGRPGFKGLRGTFYWDDRVNLRRGTVNVGEESYALGLLDCTNNGRFNDDSDAVKDLLLADVHSKGKLTTYDESNVFKLTDVIPLGGERYRISSIDTYGRWIEFEKTDERLRVTFFHTSDSTVQNAGLASSVIRQIVEDSLWHVSLRTIDSSRFSLAEYRGKYILLNFWGEWCKPCLEEIPSLVSAVKELDTSKFSIISFLQAIDLEKARRIIREKEMNWTHVVLNEELGEQCQIRAYPTNILLFPDGKNCVRKSSKIEKDFFFRYMK